jgi:hypothetical protein
LKRLIKIFMSLFVFLSLIMTINSEKSFASTGWSLAPGNMSVGLVHSASATVNGKIYLFGGTSGSNNYENKIFEYDTVGNTLTTKSQMSIGRYLMSAVELNNKVYIIGGYTPSGTTGLVEEYDPVTNIIVKRASLPETKGAYSLASLNGKLYVIGGYSTTSGTNGKTYEYNPNTDSWTQKTNMPTARSNAIAQVYGAKIYVMGGGTSSAKVEVYDPTTDSWETKANMPLGRTYFSSAVLDNKILVMGGQIPTGVESDNMTNSVHIYDPNANSWASGASMSAKRYGNSAEVVNNKIYVIGGSNGTGFETTVDVYSPPFVVPTAPSLNATAGNSQVVLSWSTVGGATYYNLKRSEIAGGPYTSFANSVTDPSYTDITVTNGKTYYYIVTASNSGGESINSNEASATPQGGVGGRAILTIYLTNGAEKEYDLSMNEVNAFIDWYDQKDAGVGTAKYAFIKTWNKASFIKRTEYVIFDKILNFNVDEYSAEE